LGGCGGGGASSCVGGDQVCPVLVTFYSFQPASWQTPPAPVAVNASVDIAFTEIRCTQSSNNRKPLPGTGCSAPYPPAAPLGVRVLTMTDGGACPLTSSVVAPGTLRFTRTGPGDPKLRAGSGGLPGYCAVDVSDPGRGDWVIVL
jgi:hypothetical protein